ncbi:hypothetical protein [Tissierella creatinophila]|nr:hypothetical protein [Tissierella creatinophila]
MLDKPLLNALLDEYVYFHDIANEYNIKTAVDCFILGFIYLITEVK